MQLLHYLICTSFEFWIIFAWLLRSIGAIAPAYKHQKPWHCHGSLKQQGLEDCRSAPTAQRAPFPRGCCDSGEQGRGTTTRHGGCGGIWIPVFSARRLEPQVSADDDFQVCVTWRSRGNVHGSCKDLLPECRTCAMTNFQLEGGKLRGLFREAVGQHNYFYME